MPRRPHYHVYVIELSKDVLYEPKFKKNNPGYVEGKPCVYVADASTFPRLPSKNLTFTAMANALRIADGLLRL